MPPPAAAKPSGPGYGNFDVILGPLLADFSAPDHRPHASLGHTLLTWCTFFGGGFWGFLFCLLPIRCNAQFFRPGVPGAARRPPLVSSPKKAPPPVAVRPGSMSKSSPAVASRRPPAAAAALAAALTGALSPPPAAAAAKKPAPTPAAAPAAAAAAAGTRTGSAMYAYNAADATQISVTGGEELTVVQSDSDWTFVENASGHRGYVPTSYLQL